MSVDDRRWGVSGEVAGALKRGEGVVALESTLITHGLPWPVNLETAKAAEIAVRESGSVPATIAILNGKVRIGLSGDEIEEMARSVEATANPAERFHKVGRRDIGMALTLKQNGAATVSATLFLARSVGLSIMATGGLGGVHREASTTFDISSDLDELARADGTLVVCSGVKSILDMSATLERLETLGVAVAGYRTNEFPAFTTVGSGLTIDSRIDSPDDAARLLENHRGLGIPGAIVLAQAVEAEFSVDRDRMEKALSQALTSAKELGVGGKAVTPFLLDQLRSRLSGETLRANQRLIVRNAALAGEVATLLARLGTA